MSKGATGGSQTTTVQPWSGSIPSLNRGLKLNARLLDNRQLAPAAYGGPRVAGMRPAQTQGMDDIIAQARGMGGFNNQAQGAVSGMLGAGNAGLTQQAGGAGLSAVMGDFARGGNAPNVSLADVSRGGRDVFGFMNNQLDGASDRTYRDLDAVKSNVLGSVIPQVSSMFSDTGGLDSSAAMDTIGRAAAEAIAPIEYGAYNDAMNRNTANLNTSLGLSSGTMEGNAARDFAGGQAALGRGVQVAGMGNDLATRGATLAPSIAGLQFLPGQQMIGVGGMQQGQRQNEINARMDEYNQNASRPYDNLVRYMQIAQGTAGLGGTTTQPGTGPSALGALGGAGMTGLGMYGALAMNPATAGVALPLGVGAGLAGLMGAF